MSMTLLPPKSYHRAIVALEKVTINHFFARSVILHHIRGEVFVDDIENPTTFLVIHPYGMGLLFGEHGNQAFNEEFIAYALNLLKDRNRTIWLQVYPENWYSILDESFRDHLGEKIKMNTRLNFDFDREVYLKNKKTFQDHSEITIRKTTKETFEEMQGTVVPRFLWENADHFEREGFGLSLYENGVLASTAFSCFLHDEWVEIGIETRPDFQGKGYARMVCSAFIDECLRQNKIPVWACRKENVASLSLAQKLGFFVTKEVPFYGLMPIS